MSAPSASWESTLLRVKELPTLNNVYLYGRNSFKLPVLSWKISLPHAHYIMHNYATPQVANMPLCKGKVKVHVI